MFPKSLAAVNSVIMLHAHAPLQIGTIAALAGITRPVALSAVVTLEKRGLVTRSRRLKHDEIAPNAQSLYYPAAYHTALIDMPIDAVLAPYRWLAVFAYGSMSRPGGGRRDSDIDLLVVGRFPEISAQLKLQLDLVDLGVKSYGRRFDALIVSPEEARAGLELDDPHMTNAIKEGVLIRGEWM
ncbi:MAG TPA: nucleotidyltransferase domain-containing protein [Candidatus Limnocylindrales bacterium]